jgi:hypothetical protein
MGWDGDEKRGRKGNVKWEGEVDNGENGTAKEEEEDDENRRRRGKTTIKRRKSTSRKKATSEIHQGTKTTTKA